MTDYVIASDNIDKKESQYLQAIKTALQNQGHHVTIAGVGPNTIQAYGRKPDASGKVGVFLVGGSDLGMYYDFEQGVKNGYYKYSSMIVAFASWISNKWVHEDYIKNKKLGRAHDDNYSTGYINKISGKYTAHEYITEQCSHVSYVVTSKSGIDGATDLGNMIASNGFGSSTSDGSTIVESGVSNPMLAGDRTFQEIISEICEGIDILFLCKKNRVVVTDFEQIYSDALYLREHNNYNTKDEDIKLWQLEDGSYQLNVDQFGFYNAVVVYYNGGKVYEQFDDLVDVYGAQVKAYNDMSLTKSQAQAKAKAYLAAHVRDFNMGIQASVLENGIDIGDIVTLDNPLSYHKYKKIPEFLFTNGVSISWDGDYIYTDLELQYGPESPERPEVPTTGVGSVSGSSKGQEIGDDAIQVGNDLASKYQFNYSASTYCGMRSTGGGDCHAWSAALWQELKNIGYAVRIVQYATSQSSNHRSVQYKDNSGNWQDYPYSSTNLPRNATATSGAANGTVVVDENGLGSASHTIC